MLAQPSSRVCLTEATRRNLSIWTFRSQSHQKKTYRRPPRRFFGFSSSLLCEGKTVSGSWAEIRDVQRRSQEVVVFIAHSRGTPEHVGPVRPARSPWGEKRHFAHTNSHTWTLMSCRTGQPSKRIGYLWILVCSWASLEDADMEKRQKKHKRTKG